MLRTKISACLKKSPLALSSFSFLVVLFVDHIFSVRDFFLVESSSSSAFFSDKSTKSHVRRSSSTTDVTSLAASSTATLFFLRFLRSRSGTFVCASFIFSVFKRPWSKSIYKASFNPGIFSTLSAYLSSTPTINGAEVDKYLSKCGGRTGICTCLQISKPCANIAVQALIHADNISIFFDTNITLCSQSRALRSRIVLAEPKHRKRGNIALPEPSISCSLPRYPGCNEFGR
mmetsp:Transcript_11611/g.17591  ORF Transcript_11611/g.17591 Transcript_11611/m.17591 type:complete len:231 (-) Transcript_11611:1009-1701(-)